MLIEGAFFDCIPSALVEEVKGRRKSASLVTPDSPAREVKKGMECIRLIGHLTGRFEGEFTLTMLNSYIDRLKGGP